MVEVVKYPVVHYYDLMSKDAQEAWGLLFRLFVSQRGRVPAIAAQYDLSPMQAHVLRLLEPGAPLPMRRLARKLGCDASNVTGIVDRLEERGLLVRAVSAVDRRVKMLVLTEAGIRLRQRILADLAEAPEPIARLSADDQRALREILSRALEPTA
jgi:MarR family transcriptional regulator, organic hydroperoxide resistance regulator